MAKKWQAHLKGSWTGTNSGVDPANSAIVPTFTAAMQAPSPGATLRGTALFVGNPLDSTGAATDQYNSFITSVECWRGPESAPVAKLGNCSLGGYGWQFAFDTTTLADSTYYFHFKFIRSNATNVFAPALFLAVDNVTPAPTLPAPDAGTPAPTYLTDDQIHSKVREAVWLGTNTDVANKEAAWGDVFLGRKKFYGGGDLAGWVANYKSMIDEASPTSGKRMLTIKLAPQNDTLVTAITSGANPVVTTTAAMDLQTGDRIMLWGCKTGSAYSNLNSSTSSRKGFAVTRLTSTTFRLDGQSFEGSYNTTTKATARAGWGQIEMAAGRFNTQLRQVRDYLLAKLAAYTTAQRTAYLANFLHNPAHELNGTWYAQATSGDKTYDGRSGARTAMRDAWRLWYRILMYEESGYSGAVPTTARTNSLANLYGARALKWGIEWASFVQGIDDAIGMWPGDEFVDTVAMNMYPLTNSGNQTQNVWDGTGMGMSAYDTSSVKRKAVALGVLPSSILTNGKGDCQKDALDFLAAWARNTNNCRNASGFATGDTRTLTIGVGEWSAVALKTKSGVELTYTADTVPKQQIAGIYTWAKTNYDILNRICIFDVDKDEGYFAAVLPLPGWSRSGANHGLPADANYRAHTGVGTARSLTANKPSHRPTVSNYLLDIFGRR